MQYHSDMWRQLFVPLLLMVIWSSDQACAGISATLTTIKDMVTDLQDQMVDMRHKMAQIDDIESQLSALRTVQYQTKEKVDKIDTIEAQLSALGTRQEQMKEKMDNGEGSPPLFDPGVVEARLTGVNGKAEKMDESSIDAQLTSIQLQLAEIQGNTASLDAMESQLTVMAEQLRDLPSITDSQVQSGVTNISERIEDRCPAGSAPSLRRSLSEKFIREEGDYFLAFRLTGGIRTSAYDKYVTVGHNDDDNDVIYSTVPCSCKTPGGSNCDRHYRSELLDLWPELPVEKVKVSVYAEGEEKVRLVFDGHDTDHLTFFALDRLLVSPFTDLPSDFSSVGAGGGSFFSIEGDGRQHVLRRFFINKNYNGCPVDQGWLMVSEKESNSRACSWEEQGGATPVIRYSLKNESAQYALDGESAIADVLTISIKLTEDDDQC